MNTRSQRNRQHSAADTRKITEKNRLGVLPGIAAVLLIAAVMPMLLLPGCGGEAVRFDSAEEICDFFQNNSEDLGYDNALSELSQQYTTAVDDDSYYRLLQNYRGFPVYGRTLVVTVDEAGNPLSSSCNVQDIPADIDLQCSVSKEQAEQGILEFLTEEYPEEVWSACPEFELDPETLCIYSLEGPACLAYEVSVADWLLMIHAQTGKVVHSQPASVSDFAMFAETGEIINVDRMKDGTYVLKDEETNTYVLTADKKTYYHPDLRYSSRYRSENLTLATSADGIFGNEDDSISRESMATAEKMLFRVNHIRHFFESLKSGMVGKLILIYDDKFGRFQGENGLCASGNLNRLIGSNNYDGEWYSTGKVISIGYVYSADPEQYADIIAHEYTHAVTWEIVDWTFSSRENAALNEAFSDIFGELYEAELRGEDPDWLHGVKKTDGKVEYITRNLMDPTNNAPINPESGEPFPLRDGLEYPVRVYDSYDETNSHIGSTIVSHIAYLLYAGSPEIPDSAISLANLKELWFRTMLLLPPDAKFVDCRIQMQKAAEHMKLTDAQKQWIGCAFDNAGIYYELETPCSFEVYDAQGAPFENYDVTAEWYSEKLSWFGGATEKQQSVPVEKDGALFRMPTKAGTYRITLQNRDIPGENITLEIEVGDSGEDEAPRILPLYTAFTKSEEEPEPTEPTVDTGEAPYSIIRWDRSAKTETGESSENYYIDYVVLEGEDPAYEKINARLYLAAERLMSRYESGEILEEYGNGHGYCYGHSQVIHNGGGIFGVAIITDEYTGGNRNHFAQYIFFFSLRTGEEATLADLVGMDEETLLPELRRVAWEGLYREYGSMLQVTKEGIYSWWLQDFQYVVKEGRIWLYFGEYTVMAGAYGAVAIPTDWYLPGYGPEAGQNE